MHRIGCTCCLKNVSILFFFFLLHQKNSFIYHRYIYSQDAVHNYVGRITSQDIDRITGQDTVHISPI